MGPADPTTAWARDVVDGRILSGELVRYAAERHLRDLKDGPARGLHWRPEKAAHPLGFFPAVLSITAGAKVGEPFHPLPWHGFVIGSLFGWRKDSGRMRFRAGWLETGKGQAKSPLMAAIGLYLMGWAGIHRSQIYAIGQDKATANVLFGDAVAMCRAPIPGSEDESETLEFRGDVIIRGEGDNAWKLEAEHLAAVDGAVIDKTFVAAQVAEIVAEHDVQFLAFDPAGMADFSAACEEIALPVWRWKGAEEPQGEGLKLVAHGQGNKVAYEDRQLVMPRSIERLEDRILTERITIAHSPVTYACAANAQMLPDGQGNRSFDKRRSRGRIDGIVTIAMGVGAATMNETPTFEPDAWIASYA